MYDQKISRVGKYSSCYEGYQNARRRKTFQTTKFMDRESIRNRKKIINLLGNTF